MAFGFSLEAEFWSEFLSSVVPVISSLCLSSRFRLWLVLLACLELDLLRELEVRLPLISDCDTEVLLLCGLLLGPKPLLLPLITLLRAVRMVIAMVLQRYTEMLCHPWNNDHAKNKRIKNKICIYSNSTNFTYILIYRFKPRLDIVNLIPLNHWLWYQVVTTPKKKHRLRLLIITKELTETITM